MMCLLAARATVSFASRQILPVLLESNLPMMANVKTPSRVPRFSSATVEDGGCFMIKAPGASVRILDERPARLMPVSTSSC
jgi:hypothetical protein